jgi:hypothetical protein
MDIKIEPSSISTSIIRSKVRTNGSDNEIGKECNSDTTCVTSKNNDLLQSSAIISDNLVNKSSPLEYNPNEKLCVTPLRGITPPTQSVAFPPSGVTKCCITGNDIPYSNSSFNKSVMSFSLNDYNIENGTIKLIGQKYSYELIKLNPDDDINAILNNNGEMKILKNKIKKSSLIVFQKNVNSTNIYYIVPNNYFESDTDKDKLLLNTLFSTNNKYLEIINNKPFNKLFDILA